MLALTTKNYDIMQEQKIITSPNCKKKFNIFIFSENGFSMKDDKVCIPACKVKAVGWLDAKNKLDAFLSTRILTEDIELITPINRIDFN